MSPKSIALSPTSQWYCATVRSNNHRRAELDLNRLGFRTFFPKTRKWATHARVKRPVEKPILGRYLFVDIDHPQQSFSQVRTAIGIDGMITRLGTPIPFPSKWVDDLLIRYLKGEWDEIENGKIPVGARIRIMEGEFSNMLATVISSKGKLVGCKILGEARIATLPESLVRAA